jgi:hypothetical protein
MHDIRLAGALVLAAATLAAYGCGGASKTASSAVTTSAATQTAPSSSTVHTESAASTQPLTRAQLIAAADMICRRVNLKRASIKLSSLADYAHLLPELAAYERAAVAQMRKLVPPASMASSWQRLISAGQTVAGGTAAVGEHATASGLREVESQSIAAGKALERSLTLAKREGFKDCAQSH